LAAILRQHRLVDHDRRNRQAASRDLRVPEGGIVSFRCVRASALGFDVRTEIDPNFPKNAAHAHVYYDGSNSSRKKNARRLAQECRVVVAPSF
jgi:hypothetical protein